MNRPPFTLGRLPAIAGIIALGIGICPAASPLAQPDENTGRLHAVTQVECITPDGHVAPVSDVASRNAPATIKNEETISCPLREGKTIFIISFSKVAMMDRFTFVNENATAQGQLEIAVSNSPLPANSPEWTAVNGAIPFARKRLFNLSMIGVEARYVKLSFKVENSTAAAGRLNLPQPLRTSARFDFGYLGIEKLPGFCSAR